MQPTTVACQTRHPCAEVRNVTDLVRRARTPVPIIRPALARPRSDLGGAERRVDEVAAALAALGPAGAGSSRPRRDRAAQRARVRRRLFATLRANLVAVPVNPGYTARELGHILATRAPPCSSAAAT